MDSFVFIAVLAAAACHAGWNTLLKFRLEPVTATAWWRRPRASWRVPAVLVTGLPALASWPYLLGSVGDPRGLLPDAGRGLPRRRSRPDLSDRARHRAADDRRSGQRLDARDARRLRLGRRHGAGDRHPAAGVQGRAGAERRRAVGRLCAAHVADHHRLHDRRRTGRATVGRARRLHGLAVPAQRRGDGRARHPAYGRAPPRPEPARQLAARRSAAPRSPSRPTPSPSGR